MRPVRRCGLFSLRRCPRRRRDWRRVRGRRRRRGSGSGGPTSVKWRRLLYRMPILMIGPDRAQQIILVGPLLAAAVVLRLALPHADPRDEDDVIEVLERRLIRRARLLAGVAGLDAAGALENFL